MDRKEIKKTCGGFVAEERSRHVETIGKLRLSLSFDRVDAISFHKISCQLIYVDFWTRPRVLCQYSKATPRDAESLFFP